MNFNQTHETNTSSEFKRTLCRNCTPTSYYIKKAAVIAALDLILSRVQRSPQRCARNLIELGNTSFPDKFLKQEQAEIYQELLFLCKNKDIVKARELFLLLFLN